MEEWLNLIKFFIMSEDVFKLPVFNINGEKINKNVDLTELKDINISCSKKLSSKSKARNS